jgi:IS5 family transposase
LFTAADGDLEAELRAVLASGDDYASAAKPQIDWDDADARDALIDSRARDAFACLVLLDGRELDPGVGEAAELVATVVGQDLEETDDAMFRIARRVAKDRVISTVDPEARHGHKSSARGFDGYKGHVAVDPDSEIITDTVVSPGNAGDASVAEDLIDDLLAHATDRPADAAEDPKVYGDSAYGTGEFQSRLEDADIASGCKTQPPSAPGGRFAKDRFDIDLEAETVTCPNNVTVGLRPAGDRLVASFAGACIACPLRTQCTTSAAGRKIRVGEHEAILVRARARQTDPTWQADYRATRPKVERKLGHLMRRRHGGRRARVRGTRKVDSDFNLLAAAANLARLAMLGVHSTNTGQWAMST